MNINIISAYAAAHEAVTGFKTLPAETLKTFIFTGNAFTHIVLPVMLSFGMAKVAGAHLIESAAQAYASEGFRYVLTFGKG